MFQDSKLKSIKLGGITFLSYFQQEREHVVIKCLLYVMLGLLSTRNSLPSGRDGHVHKYFKCKDTLKII